MESNGGDAGRILAEIQSLKASKTDLDNRIAALESQLRLLNFHNDTVSSNGSCPSISNPDFAFGHDLSPDMIYRYSRHLLLPAFGVQGSLFIMKLIRFVFTLQL